ncbi:cytoskeleton-associated protein 5-like isoform X2 [Babylonia areolata]|uniref:cytoskeleton-associated protein 5-like isoform X2 n=1 Tax=Babylonia areolata TaxID=304850 RepID=UPI003FD60C30
MGDDSEWMKLPTDEKCGHKLWKARVAGYEELMKIFAAADNEKSPEFSKHAGLMKKIVTDNNAVAQEKGLDVVVSFVENAATQIAVRTINEVVSGVVTKCLNATKQKTKDKGMEIVMLYIELDKPDLVQECLMGGLENKNPKVVIGSIQCLKVALRDFGTKVVQVKPLLKVLPKLLDDRDKNVREETKQLVIELYRWIGAALKPQMSNFKPIQVQEFEEEFEKITGGKPTQSRFMRSQQDLKAKIEEQAAAAAGGDGGDEDGEEEGGEDLDPYELMTAVDVLSKIPKDFFEKIEAKKWQERREALEALQKLVESPKIENGSFGTLVSSLLKVIGKDSNVMLVALAANCLTGLAKGLRKNFATYATNCITVIVEKFKEKKQNVVTALREASDAVYSTGVSLEALLEDLVGALDNKNPNIKAETALFLGRCFTRCTQATLPKKMLKAFCTAFLKTISDTDPGVREASYEAVGVAMKVVSEKHIMPFLADVDPIKMQKIQEYCQKAVLLNAKGEPRGGGGGGAAAAPAPKKNEPKPVARPASAASTSKPAASDSAPAASAAKTAAKKPAGKKAGGGGAGAKKGKGAAGKGAKGDNQPAETILSDEAVEEKAAAALPADVLTGLASANWKERLAAMEKFSDMVKTMSKEEIPCQVFVRVLKKKPGLKETNFQVLKLKLELLGHLGKEAKFSRQAAEFVLGEIIDKVGDVKNGAAAQETLSCISEACSLEFVSEQAMILAFEQKNPKNQSETLNWLAGAIKEFGLKVNIKPMIKAINNGLAATNPAVRSAAISVLSTAYMYMGPKLRVFFEEEKPALLQQIDAEFEKVKGQKPPAATRGLAPGGDGEEEEEERGEGGTQEEEEVQDLVPRTDISERITESLLTMMADKNWKVRNEGLQKVTDILKEAKFITANIGGLPEAVKVRLGESNKNLQMAAINICSMLATAMGAHCKQHVRVIVPGLISCLSDSKPQLRAAVVACLNLWVEQTTLVPFVECEALLDGLKTENPNVRAELLGWLSEKLPTHKLLPAELRDCVLPVLTCLEDRSADVRKRAQDAIVPFMIHVGYNTFVKVAGKLKPASKDQVQPLLEKARGELPAKAPPPKKKAAEPPKAASRPVSAVDDDDEEEEDSKPAPAKKAEAKNEKSDLKSKAVGKARGKTPVSSSKKKEEEDTGPVMSTTVPLQQRVKDEKNMKVLKWNFIELRGEYVDQLKGQMEKNFSAAFMAQLFHSDFKFHIKAIEQLITCIDTMEKETLNNLDMILKWCSIRFFDTNPSMINKALDYLRRLFTHLADLDFSLSDLDANSFIPYLVLKVGDSKDNVRRDVRNIFKLICKVYPASKLFVFLLDGLKSKNSKQRTECLEEMGCLIEQYGINICQPSPAQALKAIAAQISDRDNGVRNAALNSVVTAYMLLGENVYKFIGHLKEKDQSLLEERIKRSMKNKPASKPLMEERPSTAPSAPAAPRQSGLQRPSTAMPKSSSANTLRKEYALDVDTEPTGQLNMPQLIQHDLEDIYEPIKLPKIRARPPSPMRHLTSTDAAATIGYVISQVTNTDIGVSVQALAQIDEVLRDEDRAEALSGHVDKLLLMLSVQFRMAHSTHMSDAQVPRTEVVRLYRCLLSTLLQIFQTVSLAGKASKDVLRDLMTSLVTVMLDDRLMELDDGPQVVRSVNLTVVRIVEKADCTSIMGALIRLLQDCVTSETTSAKFMEIVMKCLWKMVRMLPTMCNELNIDKILLDAHQFMQALPCHTWKQRANDQPLRTIKTVLHSLAKQKGNKILSHTGLIESNSEVEAYLHKVLKDGVAGNNARNEEMSEMVKQGSSSKSKRLSKSTHDMLVEIFKKIGSKENTKEGLNDLYDFKKKYPDADLEPFLKKSSQFFQNYIERGLKNIELEREGKKPETLDPIPAMKPLSENTANGDSVGADYYMQRLTAIRARCGLDGAEQQQQQQQNRAEKSTPTSKSSHSSSEADLENIGTSSDCVPDIRVPAVTKAEPSASSKPAVDVSELKMRLERIKKMATS